MRKNIHTYDACTKCTGVCVSPWPTSNKTTLSCFPILSLCLGAKLVCYFETKQLVQQQLKLEKTFLIRKFFTIFMMCPAVGLIWPKAEPLSYDVNPVRSYRILPMMIILTLACNTNSDCVLFHTSNIRTGCGAASLLVVPIQHTTQAPFFILPHPVPPLCLCCCLKKHHLLQASLWGVFGQVIVMKKDRGEFSREMLWSLWHWEARSDLCF